ncbi:ATP-grasp domain-containing protein [Paenibacillus swuensis]|nr:hypothetical protein [Paenibacillus swuensis]
MTTRKKAIIITDYAGYVRENFYPENGVNLEVMVRKLRDYGVEAQITGYQDLANSTFEIKDTLILYSSSQQPDYKAYIDDILYELSKHNQVVPRYEIFRAHENKGYQELLKAAHGFSSLHCHYLATARDFLNIADQINYPVVIKKMDGSMSKNVVKADTREEAVRHVHKFTQPAQPIRYFLSKWLDQFILKKKYVNYERETDYIGRYVVQQFVPGLQEDWRVLVCGDKYYVLKRGVRKHDFRASGSGLFTFDHPPEGMLDYAKSLYTKLDSPFLSMDICKHEGGFDVFEFQGTHFGPAAIINSEHYYRQHAQGTWEKVVGKSNYSEVYIEAIISYLDHTTGFNRDAATSPG